MDDIFLGIHILQHNFAHTPFRNVLILCIPFFVIALKYYVLAPTPVRDTVWSIYDSPHYRKYLYSKKAEWDGNSSYRVGFSLTYEDMERNFKVYMYPDEVLNKYYWLKSNDTDKLPWQYMNEGYFFKNIQESHFLTTNPDEARLFLIPIRTHLMDFMGRSHERMAIRVQKHVRSLIQKHPFWNQSQGADHIFVNCHEIGVMATRDLPLLKNAIQVLCTTWDALEFNPSKDLFLPPIGNDLTKRRKMVLLQLSEELEIGVCSCSTALHLYYAACIAEAIIENCIPFVSLSNPDLPFNNTLDWTKFSVIATKKDVSAINSDIDVLPQLVNIVNDIDDETLIKLFSNLRKVQPHFYWYTSPFKFDAFHMFMYELWLRINQ